MDKMPTHKQLRRMMEIVKTIVFPIFFEPDGVPELEMRSVLIAQLQTLLNRGEAVQIADKVMKQMPSISELIEKDAEATRRNDPAATDYAEVVLCYPVITAMLYHRVAHALLKAGAPLLPRMLSEMAHSDTGIDIHPAATIGEYFCIDHGTGVVIGATTIIGNNVVIYQGVTLGAKNFQYDAKGAPIDKPRHPIIEDNVTIYSNASVLGRITIGHDSVIGGNVWLTHDVPPYSRILQQKAVQLPTFSDGEGI